MASPSALPNTQPACSNGLTTHIQTPAQLNTTNFVMCIDCFLICFCCIHVDGLVKRVVCFGAHAWRVPRTIAWNADALLNGAVSDTNKKKGATQVTVHFSVEHHMHPNILSARRRGRSQLLISLLARAYDFASGVIMRVLVSRTSGGAFE